MGRTPFVREINRVIFTPFNADAVGIYENPFTTVTTTGLGDDAKFCSSEVVGNKVIFTPSTPNVVGIYDVENNSFSTVATGVHVPDPAGEPFKSSAVVGNKVIFTPYDADEVGIFDVSLHVPGENRGFSTDATWGVDGEQGKFRTSVVVGNKVIFTPDDAGKVGIFDVSLHVPGEDRGFSTVEMPRTLNPSGLPPDFVSSAVVGNKVIFTPLNANVVGIFDVALHVPGQDLGFSTVTTTGLTNTNKFASSAVVGNKVIFTPLNANFVGIFDVENNSFSTVATTGLTNTDDKFVSSAVVGNKVIFTPSTANAVGIFDVALHVPGQDVGFSTVATGLEGGNKFISSALVTLYV